jgi:hypothetical protein
MCIIAMFIRPTELAIFYSDSSVSKINIFESLVTIGTFFDTNRLGEVADNKAVCTTTFMQHALRTFLKQYNFIWLVYGAHRIGIGCILGNKI